MQPGSTGPAAGEARPPADASRWRRLVVVGLLAGAGLVAAACGSSSPPNGSSSPPNGSPSSTSSGSLPPGGYFQQSGTGSSVVSGKQLPATWTVTWHFSCQHPATRSKFALTVTKDGGHPVQATNQRGLAGGGYKPFTGAGTYSFAVSTPCSWTITAANKETETPASTTTTASGT